MKSSSVLDDILDKNIEKIDRRAKIFKNNSSLHLSVHIEKNPHKDQYFCWGQLYMPRKVISARGNSRDIVLAIGKAFSALSKQMEKVKYKVERHLHKKGKAFEDFE